MLIVLAVISAAFAAWLFIALYEIGHRETLPAWAEKYGGLEFAIPLAIAGCLFAVLLPAHYFLDEAPAPFGAAELLASLFAAGIGFLAVAWQAVRVRRLMRQRRNVLPLSAAGLSAPKVTPLAAYRSTPGGNPRPQRPSGGRSRARRAA